MSSSWSRALSAATRRRMTSWLLWFGDIKVWRGRLCEAGVSPVNWDWSWSFLILGDLGDWGWGFFFARI